MPCSNSPGYPFYLSYPHFMTREDHGLTGKAQPARVRAPRVLLRLVGAAFKARAAEFPGHYVNHHQRLSNYSPCDRRCSVPFLLLRLQRTAP
jgi:hypothetical protein